MHITTSMHAMHAAIVNEGSQVQTNTIQHKAYNIIASQHSTGMVHSFNHDQRLVKSTGLSTMASLQCSLCL